MLFCRHSIFLPALRIALQSGNSSAMTTCDHIDIAVVIHINTDRMIVPMFAATSSAPTVTPDRETETPDVQGLFRRNLSNASALAPNDQARDADVSARCLMILHCVLINEAEQSSIPGGAMNKPLHPYLRKRKAGGI